MNAPERTQRVDKWLWVARFFKSRSLAAQAVSGGKVQVDGQRVKPARAVGPGSAIRIRKGAIVWDVVVDDVSRHRRPAREAASLYRETEQSRQLREAGMERRRAERAAGAAAASNRPDKKGRREIIRMKHGSEPPRERT